MPILNIQVKVENNKIVYKWFRKEMSNYLLLLANLAMPERTKRECLVQYAMTILLHLCTGPGTISLRRGGRRS